MWCMCVCFFLFCVRPTCSWLQTAVCLCTLSILSSYVDGSCYKMFIVLLHTTQIFVLSVFCLSWLFCCFHPSLRERVHDKNFVHIYFLHLCQLQTEFNRNSSIKSIANFIESNCCAFDLSMCCHSPVDHKFACQHFSFEAQQIQFFFSISSQMYTYKLLLCKLSILKQQTTKNQNGMFLSNFHLQTLPFYRLVERNMFMVVTAVGSSDNSVMMTKRMIYVKQIFYHTYSLSCCFSLSIPTVESGFGMTKKKQAVKYARITT